MTRVATCLNKRSTCHSQVPKHVESCHDVDFMMYSLVPGVPYCIKTVLAGCVHKTHTSTRRLLYRKAKGYTP